MSGNDVGDQMILHHGDLIAQAQLALLEPRQLNLIVSRNAAQRFYRRVEVTMLVRQRFESRAQFDFVHVDPRVCRWLQCSTPVRRRPTLQSLGTLKPRFDEP